MSEKENVFNSTAARQVHTVFFEEVWFKGLLLHVQEVSAEHASRPNPGGTSSAAGQIGHVLYWLRLGRRWLAEEQVDGNQDASFTHVQVNEAEWKTLRTELEEEAERFQHDVQGIREWNEQKLNIILNQLTHAAYHAGSVIQILKSTT